LSAFCLSYSFMTKFIITGSGQREDKASILPS
jgi:hypothetical protein